MLLPANTPARCERITYQFVVTIASVVNHRQVDSNAWYLMLKPLVQNFQYKDRRSTRGYRSSFGKIPTPPGSRLDYSTTERMISSNERSFESCVDETCSAPPFSATRLFVPSNPALKIGLKGVRCLLKPQNLRVGYFIFETNPWSQQLENTTLVVTGTDYRIVKDGGFFAHHTYMDIHSSGKHHVSIKARMNPEAKKMITVCLSTGSTWLLVGYGRMGGTRMYAILPKISTKKRLAAREQLHKHAVSFPRIEEMIPNSGVYAVAKHSFISLFEG